MIGYKEQAERVLRLQGVTKFYPDIMELRVQLAGRLNAVRVGRNQRHLAFCRKVAEAGGYVQQCVSRDL